MTINDLSYLGEATEETAVTGGYYYYYGPRNTASANASAVALGYRTSSSTYTSATVSRGRFSSSHSSSYASTY